MRLIVRFLDLELVTDSPAYEAGEDDDCSRDLSGGTLGSYPIETGPTDRYLGFTNGREVGDD